MNLLPTPINLLPHVLKLCIPLALGIALGWHESTGYWQVRLEQANTKVATAERDKEKGRADGYKEVFDQAKQWKDQYDRAIQEASTRTQRSLSAAAAARSESGRLRDLLATADARAKTASADAVREYAATCNRLLGDMEAEGGAMAELAQRHANDVQTLTNAWPK